MIKDNPEEWQKFVEEIFHKYKVFYEYWFKMQKEGL